MQWTFHHLADFDTINKKWTKKPEKKQKEKEGKRREKKFIEINVSISIEFIQKKFICSLLVLCQCMMSGNEKNCQ